MLKRISLIALAAIGAACGGGDETASPQPPASPPVSQSAPSQPARPYPQSDLQVAQLIYSTGPRTPEGFQLDPVPTGPSYVATTHLKSSDVGMASAPGEPVHEVCTDDWNQALEWSETAARRLPSYGDLVATNTEARYFEFVRVPREAPSAQARQRIFRCIYLDRSGADSRAHAGAGGYLKSQPLTAADVRHLAEYLWHFTTFNNFGNAVLVSVPDPEHGPLAHGLVLATLHRASSPAECDRIEIVRWSHVADASTGALTRSLTALATLYARETQGLVTLCEAP